MKKLNSYLYYAAFILIVLLRLFYMSKLINFPTYITKLMVLFAIFLLVLKIMLDEHSFKELVLIVLFGLIFIFLYIKDVSYVFLTTYLAFVGIKNVNIKNVIKIDLVLKLFFIIIHCSLFALDYLFYDSAIVNEIFITSKGVVYSLFTNNPNNLPTLVFWMIIDIIFLAKNNKARNFIIYFIIISIFYELTKTRTVLILFFILLILYIIKDKKIVNSIYKYSYFIMFLISILLLKLHDIFPKMFFDINSLLSNRLSYPYNAINNIGVRFMPLLEQKELNMIYIIDNFYLKSLVFYGIIILLLMGIPFLLKKKNTTSKQILICLITAFYLFLEVAPIDVGYAISYLIIGNMIFNKGVRNNE